MESVNIKEILTDREIDVMEYVSSGLYNKEIADILKCEICTIKKHLQHIFTKMGVNNRIEAALRFLEITGRIIRVAGCD